MSVQLEVSLDLSGESLSVYYPKEDTKINITVVPALNCYNQVTAVTMSSHLEKICWILLISLYFFTFWSFFEQF